LGLLKRLSFWGKRKNRESNVIRRTVSESFRNCRFETMEERQVLSADPITVGGVYIEDDSGTDNNADSFYVSFEGGSDTTRMTQIIIDGNQDGNPAVMSEPDVYFDITPNSGLGSGGAHAFKFDANSIGLTASDILRVQVSDGGTRLIIDLANFEAGDVLKFGIDVDQYFTGKPDDQVTSGVEFAGSSFQAFFEDPHYTFTPDPTTATGTFAYSFDFGADEVKNTGVLTGLPTQENLLSSHGFQSQENRTAGVIKQYDLVPKPVTICGTVYHDRDMDLTQDANEEGIAGTKLSLQELNASGKYVDVKRDGKVVTTTTDANGDYCFGEELKLQPGTYRIVETQPADYPFSVGAVPGTVQGTSSGVATNANVIAEVHIPLGDMHSIDNDFGEVKGAKVSGYVYHDVNYNGVKDAGDKGIANVELELTGKDFLGNEYKIQGFTDANGYYCFEKLAPGTYEVCEIQPAGFEDYQENVGTVRGATVGSSTQNDKIRGIKLGSEDVGLQYNFGEVTYASISGHVGVESPNGECVPATSPNYKGISGVEIQLIDKAGNVTKTKTDANGFYEFTGLKAGEYTIVEVTPAGYLDGDEHAGTVAGVTMGKIVSDDRLGNIKLAPGDAGINYDFCEVEPASVCGVVYHDRNNNGIQEAGEEGIKGVKLRLLDVDGKPTGQEVLTAADGSYCFKELAPGEYKIQEVQPTGWLDGKETVGKVGGKTVGATDQDDSICYVVLAGGDQGVQYNFGELQPASICGVVYHDRNDNGVQDAGEEGIQGVKLRLLDADGKPTGLQVSTAADGSYCFNELLPGEYKIEEVQPNGWLDGKETVGKVGGITVGATDQDDSICYVTVASGDKGVEYNFGEIKPASVCGVVYHDRNNNGIQEAGEEGIKGVTLRLLDADGKPTGQVTVTAADGSYCFKLLKPGEYKIEEIQPNGWTDGKETVGTVNNKTVGTTDQDDSICKIVLNAGQEGVKYNFGEYKTSSIEGYVIVDKNDNCRLDTGLGEFPIAGVTMKLLDADGKVIAVTTTDQGGFYSFSDLDPGEYTVMQIQPEGYISLDAMVGTHKVSGAEGTGTSGDNLLSKIAVTSNTHLEHYNFCEALPAKLSGYVFQDGSTISVANGKTLTPAQIKAVRNGSFSGDDKPIAGVVLELRDGITGRVITADQVLPGFYKSGPIQTTTDANGYYCFDGLPAGNYAVFEVQPDGYIDNVDTAGTTNGIAINPTDQISPFVLSTLADGVDPKNDAILRIAISAGEHSELNNFSEVLIENLPPGNPRTPPNNPSPPLPPLPPQFGPRTSPYGIPGLAGNLPVSQNTTVIAGLGTLAEETISSASYVWQLSVIDDGFPRGEEIGEKEGITWRSASFLTTSAWNSMEMSSGNWLLSTENLSQISMKPKTELVQFGKEGAIPVVGDFDGDGKDELGLYVAGEWYIDASGNRRWGQDDMWAMLGNENDFPLVGDWDGDGKDDIGVYGKRTHFDEDDLRSEPGIPDADNFGRTVPKNIPPNVAQRPNFQRQLQRTEQGETRTDVVDHIFRYGGEGDYPVVGDWNGDGIRTIGLFKNGVWTLDVDGNGQSSLADRTVKFGRAGDIPVVGDFNGDGVEDIGVFRDGKWIIDIDGNFEMDAHDKVFELGGKGDIPIVGDFDGDGVDEVGVYQRNYNAVKTNVNYN
jgi:protocatechuate 3,4-dioxygenase beta subunit